MGFESNKQMSVLEILNGTKKDIVNNIDLLAKIYTEKTGRKVCRTCTSDVNYMLLSLKNIFKMTQFKFKRHAASYKIKKGDKSAISNATLTDEKAIAFLCEDPERIRLFSVFPSNWERLLINGIDAETEKEKENRLIAEAEAAAAAEMNEINEPKMKAEDLMKMQLKDLRTMYPEISASSIKSFVEKIVAEGLAE